MSLATLTSGKGRPLVLLHGWGMNAGVWLPLLPRLEKSWQVTLVELPGHGESFPVDGDIHDWAQACLDSVPANATWLGWSLGAMVTLAAAVAAPDRIEKAVLAGGTPRFMHEPGWECGMQHNLLVNFADELFETPQRTMLRFLGLQVKGADQERETLRQLRAAVGQRQEASLVALEQGLDLLMQTDLRPELKQLEIPSLWLYGEKDTLVSEETATEVAALQPSAKVEVIPDAGHAPFLSHPDHCLAALEAFA